jgi:NADPH:quinone reductase-like Zn-dependent oxidoreductase
MRAIVVEAFGRPEHLKVIEASDQRPTSGEVIDRN